MSEPERLIHSLNEYGIHFLVGDRHPAFLQLLAPAELLAGLIVQSDARLRLALIATLLQHPEFAGHVEEVLEILSFEERPIFQLYYTAAYYLQQIYEARLISFLGQFMRLPDYFSDQLGVPQKLSFTAKLKAVARKHQEITGLDINWYGTYQHAANRVIARLEREWEWQIV